MYVIISEKDYLREQLVFSLKYKIKTYRMQILQMEDYSRGKCRNNRIMCPNHGKLQFLL